MIILGSIKNDYEEQYLSLIGDIIENGNRSDDRTGTGTMKVFARTIRHDMSQGLPLITTRQMFYKNGIVELLWMLKGDTNIRYLVQNGVNIWVGDCYKKYTTCCSANSAEWNEWMRDNGDGTLSMYTQKEFIEKVKTDNKFAEKWGELNKVYGSEWTDWYGINQLQECIDTLKTNPDSRRILVTAWNPVNVKKATLPPCHVMYQFYTEKISIKERIKLALIEFKKEHKDNNTVADGNDVADLLIGAGVNVERIINHYNIPSRKISLCYTMRSVDCGLGLPTDQLLYGLLLEMVAQCVDMVPGELVCNLVDTHVYVNQIDGLKELISRTPGNLPKLVLNKDVKDIFQFKYEDIQVVDYVHQDKIFLPLSN